MRLRGGAAVGEWGYQAVAWMGIILAPFGGSGSVWGGGISCDWSQKSEGLWWKSTDPKNVVIKWASVSTGSSSGSGSDSDSDNDRSSSGSCSEQDNSVNVSDDSE